MAFNLNRHWQAGAMAAQAVSVYQRSPAVHIGNHRICRNRIFVAV